MASYQPVSPRSQKHRDSDKQVTHLLGITELQLLQHHHQRACQNMRTGLIWRLFQGISEASPAAFAPVPEARRKLCKVSLYFFLGITLIKLFETHSRQKAVHTNGSSCSKCPDDYFSQAVRLTGHWPCGPGWPKFGSTLPQTLPSSAPSRDTGSIPPVLLGPNLHGSFLDVLTILYEHCARFSTICR